MNSRMISAGPTLDISNSRDLWNWISTGNFLLPHRANMDAKGSRYSDLN